MARFPGTEKQHNKHGFATGEIVRCRRSQANASRGVADRRGFVVDLRAGHLQLLLDADGRALWLESEAVLPEEALGDPALERLRQAYVALDGRRLERDDACWTIFGESFAADAVDRVRELLADRLRELRLAAHGVHELAVHLVLDPSPAAGDDGTPPSPTT